MSWQGEGMPRTIQEHQRDARKIIAAYCDPGSHYAYRTYDRVLGDAALTPEDVLMANLLSLRLTWQDVIPLFADGAGTSANLRRSLNRALQHLAHVPAFEDHENLEALENSLVPLANANLAATKVSGWTEVTVSKVLHRRRPHIVPIIDSRVRHFYGVRKPAQLRAALWHDVRDNQEWLETVATEFPRPDGQEMSLLRAADILIWHAHSV
jgi:hypothetical protein